MYSSLTTSTGCFPGYDGLRTALAGAGKKVLDILAEKYPQAYFGGDQVGNS